MSVTQEVLYGAVRPPLVYFRFMLVAAVEATKVPLSWTCDHTGVSNRATFAPCGTKMGVIVRLTCAHCVAQITDVAIERHGMQGSGTVYGRYRCPHGQVHQIEQQGSTLLLDVSNCRRCTNQLVHAQLN